MTLLAAALARELVDAHLPDHVRAAIAGDPVVARLLERVRAKLFTGTETPSVFTLTRFRWNLRERLADRLRYASRTLLTARVPHFRAIDLPDRLSFLYPAVRLGHEFVALPVWKTLPPRETRGQGRRRCKPVDFIRPPGDAGLLPDENRSAAQYRFICANVEGDPLGSRLSLTKGRSSQPNHLFRRNPQTVATASRMPDAFHPAQCFLWFNPSGPLSQELPYCFVLKEPAVLGQLVWLRDNPPAPGEPDSSGTIGSKSILALLARGYPTDDAVIVKASHDCNCMGNLLLDQDPRPKVVFLFAPLKVFLLQVLKAEHRRQWLREHMQQQYAAEPADDTGAFSLQRQTT